MNKLGDKIASIITAALAVNGLFNLQTLVGDDAPGAVLLIIVAGGALSVIYIVAPAFLDDGTTG